MQWLRYDKFLLGRKSENLFVQKMSFCFVIQFEQFCILNVQKNEKEYFDTLTHTAIKVSRAKAMINQ